MDVANSHHLDSMSSGADVTPDAVDAMRQRAKSTLEGKTFTLVSSADPDAPLGESHRIEDGAMRRVGA